MPDDARPVCVITDRVSGVPGDGQVPPVVLDGRDMTAYPGTGPPRARTPDHPAYVI
ncbi:hypothetical protein [Streptomyces rimosus]|uniref:hypothetical protein n=1 Tax=Streptomyces rimosus TaxID=1927 RepID=UPI00311ED0AC